MAFPGSCCRLCAETPPIAFILLLSQEHKSPRFEGFVNISKISCRRPTYFLSVSIKGFYKAQPFTTKGRPLDLPCSLSYSKISEEIHQQSKER